MLASVGELPADDAAWAYEMKWDGLRAIATVSAGALTLTSRTGRDMTSGYPELAGLAEAVGQHEVVLDGEIVALRGDGWPSFEALQQRMNVTSAGQVRRLAAEIPVSYLAFDLLFADGRALADLPYRQRRARLEELGVEGPYWQTPPAFIGVPGADVRAVSRRHGLEGIMAKRLASRYEAGKRSPAWRKIKNVYRQEFVVGGWKPGEGNRSELIGSLIVGVQYVRGPRRHRLQPAGAGNADPAAGAAAPRDLPVRLDGPGRARARRGVGRAPGGHRGGVRTMDQLGSAARGVLPRAQGRQGPRRRRPRVARRRGPRVAR